MEKEDEEDINPVEVQFFNLKKRLLLAAMFIRFFFCGAEYSVILPTALIYLQSLQASHIFMGIVVAAYPLAAMISLPITGYIYDKTKRTKELLLILNSFELIGNILYALPFSKWLPLAGRFLAGFGDGFLSLAVGEFTQLYSRSSRIRIFSLLELGRVIGLILGPTLNLFIANKSYIIQGWVLDNKTLPGAIMAVNWGIMQIITFVCVYNLSLECENLMKDNRGVDTPLLSSETSSDLDDRDNLSTNLFEPENSDDEVSEEESIKEINLFRDNEEMQEHLRELEEEKQEGEVSKGGKDGIFTTLKSLCHLEFLVIFVVDLVLWYTQTIFEVFLPYITEFNYHWTPATTGFVYMFGGIVLVVVFGLLMLSAGKIQDTTLIIFSLLLTQLALALLIYESLAESLNTKVTVFVIVSVLMFSAVPLNLVCSKTLLTKMVPSEKVGIVQGIYSAASRFALIGGPILGSALFEKRVVYGAVSSVVCFATIIFWYHSIHSIHKRERIVARETETKEGK